MNTTETEPQTKIVYVVKSYTESQKRAIQKYYQANKEKIVKKQMERAKERYQNDPEFREKNVTRMREAMRRKKAQTILEIPMKNI